MPTNSRTLFSPQYTLGWPSIAVVRLVLGALLWLLRNGEVVTRHDNSSGEAAGIAYITYTISDIAAGYEFSGCASL